MITVYTNCIVHIWQKFLKSLRSSEKWGPKDPELKRSWIEYCMALKPVNWRLFMPHPKIPQWIKKILNI